MKKHIKVLFLLAAMSLSLILLHCAKYKGQAPFFDGMYLKYQEVFDSEGRLREVHEKYPVDLGHRKLTDEES